MTQTDITRKLSNKYSLRGLREKAIEYLVNDKLLIVGPWFCSTTSIGNVTFHQGFLKGFPDDNAQDKARFAASLAVYGVDHEEYHHSFNNNKQFLISNNVFLPRKLIINDITAKYWSYSSALAEKIFESHYLKSRIELDISSVYQRNNGTRVVHRSTGTFKYIDMKIIAIFYVHF